MSQAFDIPFGSWVNLNTNQAHLAYVGNAIKIADSATAPDNTFAGDVYVLAKNGPSVDLNFTHSIWATQAGTAENETQTTVVISPLASALEAASNELSEEYTLKPGVPLYIGGEHTPITVQIPTGTTADVYTTAATQAEIDTSTADWFEWTDATKTGPFKDVIQGPISGIKIVSAAGGKVLLARSQPLTI